MLLYHGSNIEVSKPRLIGQARGLDFGAGFYLTANEEQANRFSESVQNRRGTGVPTISVFEYDEAAAQNVLEITSFPEPNADWLEFVRDNRLKIYKGKQYDVIIGPVANDRVFPTIQALIIGQFTVEAALVALRPYKLFNQYCFATEKALSMLEFVSSREK
ncbi:MAG: DUF3990 domain-containing protein [Oscillospiraceae bacterium]|jgi:hypothetical protein|nr:DUF3990 domain-containing protein [Oscillospiraceae bacterium]